MSPLQEFRCTVHNLRFGHERLASFLVGNWCPACMGTERQVYRDKIEELTAHRDLLLKAIDLKRIITRTKA